MLLDTCITKRRDDSSWLDFLRWLSLGVHLEFVVLDAKLSQVFQPLHGLELLAIFQAEKTFAFCHGVFHLKLFPA